MTAPTQLPYLAFDLETAEPAPEPGTLSPQNAPPIAWAEGQPGLLMWHTGKAQGAFTPQMTQEEPRSMLSDPFSPTRGRTQVT